MLLPGPEAQQLATYIGWLLHGVTGGIVAGLLFILPSVFVLLGLSVVYVTWGKLLWVSAIFYGLKPAVVAIVIMALWKIGKRSLLAPLHYGIALVSFLLIFVGNVSFPLIIVAVVLVGVVLHRVKPAWLGGGKESAHKVTDESDYYINNQSPVSGEFSWRMVASRAGIALVLWCVPFVLFYWIQSEPAFWQSISVFFTKAAFVTFGGAYAVLPYVAQESVEKFHWLTQFEMIDGLALGETTPGPLIMVLTFVGFMAGYHHYQGSWLAGAAGLFTTTFYTFLPSFMLILAGAPLVERTQQNRVIKSIFMLITAAVVGVILNLTRYIGSAVVFPSGDLTSPDWWAACWILVSFIMMQRYRINMILWIGISAAAGLIRYLLLTSLFIS